MTIATDTSRNGFERHFDTSAADTDLVVTTPAPPKEKPQFMLWVTVTYSAVPVHTGVIIEIDSGAGAAFDGKLLTGNANDQFVFFSIDGGLGLLNDDAIRVTAPAGGGVITSTVVIEMREVA